jgi:hypothetical protein
MIVAEVKYDDDQKPPATKIAQLEKMDRSFVRR